MNFIYRSEAPSAKFIIIYSKGSPKLSLENDLGTWEMGNLANNYYKPVRIRSEKMGTFACFKLETDVMNHSKREMCS